MKHLLNNLTEEEKNSIRGQHTEVIKVVTENFSRLINTKSGDSKPLINEQGTANGPTPPPQPNNNVTFTVPTVPNNTKSCGPKGVEDMKAAFKVRGITHLIPDKGYFVVFNTKKKYCAATAQEIVQIIS